MASPLVQQWLRQNTQSYPFPDAVYAHTDSALARYASLRPKTDVYTYDDGRTQLLLCLHGLLPIAYRGASYNIPIALWITREYPRQPPIAYVVPTSDMLVRPSKHVDVSGRCEIDYIANWARKCEGCNIVALLEAMQDHFSREPPVYAKPRTASASPAPRSEPRRPETTASPDYSARPPPPLPGTRPPQQPQALPAPPPRSDDRPPLPSKPSIASPVPAAVATAGPSADVRPSPIPPQPALATRPPPPLPPHPPQDAELPQYRSSQGPPRYSATDRPIVNPSPASVQQQAGLASQVTWAPSPPIDPSRAPRYASPPGPPPASTRPPMSAIPTAYAPPQQPPPPVPGPPRISQPQPQQPPVPLPPPFLSPQSTGTAHVNAAHGHGQLQPQPPVPPPPPHAHPGALPAPGPRPPPSIPPPDLLDAEDEAVPSIAPAAQAPAPPRPPNPELARLHEQVHAKLASELASLTQAMALDGERLRAHQNDLLAGEPAIRDEMARLEAVRDVCLSVSARVKAVVADAERNVAELKRKGDPDVDELVCATTIVHNQLINLVAEDNAIEDTIYHLHRALNAGRIDLERFLRTTRSLAEEQFMKRALTEKILTGVPMRDFAMTMRPEWS